MSLMLDEIRQQPQVLERMLSEPPGALGRLRARFSSRRPPLIVLAARGTSDNAALFGRYLFEVTLDIPTSLAAPSVVTRYGKYPIPREAVVIGISQSGESTDINTYMDCAKASGSFTIGITNEATSTLADLVDEVLPTQAGKERSVAATKTYTAQLLMIYSLARSLGADFQRSELGKLPDTAYAQLESEPRIAELAAACRDMSRAIVIARGLNYANGFEFALKLVETSYLVATGFSGADFAHGPIAMVDEEFPVFAFTPPGPTADGTKELLARLEAGRADIICIGSGRDVREVSHSRRIPVRSPLPASCAYPADTFTPIPLIIPAQLFAAHLAARKGLDPDRPRMLSKVTRTM